MSFFSRRPSCTTSSRFINTMLYFVMQSLISYFVPTARADEWFFFFFWRRKCEWCAHSMRQFVEGETIIMSECVHKKSLRLLLHSCSSVGGNRYGPPEKRRKQKKQNKTKIAYKMFFLLSARVRVYSMLNCWPLIFVFVNSRRRRRRRRRTRRASKQIEANSYDEVRVIRSMWVKRPQT